MAFPIAFFPAIVQCYHIRFLGITIAFYVAGMLQTRASSKPPVNWFYLGFMRIQTVLELS